jgi:alkylated DNA repair protein alkB family protein 6
MVDDDARCLSESLGICLHKDFISTDEEYEILAQCMRPGARWTSLSGRRVQTLGGLVHERAGLLPAPLPGWVRPLLCRLQPLLSGAPLLNHVLINAYAAGEGILAHQDGPLYFPAVAIVSLGAHGVMQFTPHVRLLDGAAEQTKTPPTLRVWLPPRSLLLFRGGAYEHYLHGIEAVSEDVPASCCNPHDAAGEGEQYDRALPRKGQRLSLTCRAVLKTRKGLLPS